MKRRGRGGGTRNRDVRKGESVSYAKSDGGGGAQKVQPRLVNILAPTVTSI